MFTGLSEEKGKIRRVIKSGSSCSLEIEAALVTEDSKIGDSIAVNGICLTVTEISPKAFTVDVMNETISRTSFTNLKSGSPVNLERAMKADGRFGGHIVSGHIDGTGKIVSIQKDSNAVWFEIETDKKILNGIVEKGSIAIDGISLTVAGVSNDSFKVSLIPHTMSVITFSERRIGDIVNLENDIIGKYVSKFLSPQKRNDGLTLEKLEEYNF